MKLEKPLRYVVLEDCYLVMEHAVAWQINHRGKGYWIATDQILDWTPAETNGPEIVVKHGGIKTIQGLQSLARQSTALHKRPGKPGTLELTYAESERQGLLKEPGVWIADATKGKKEKVEETKEKRKGLIARLRGG